MQFNNKFRMKDLFMNESLKGLFPQFTNNDKLQNIYSFSWVENKIADYIKSAFNGTINGVEVIIPGKFKERLKQIKAMKVLLENMFNNMPAITKNIRKNTRLITPFQSLEQLRTITEPMQKLQVMQIVFDNLNYNPDFQSQGRFRSEYLTADYLKRQRIWLNAVGYYKRGNYG